MKSLQLDALLGDRYPDASFHDSEIETIKFDFSRRTASFAFKVPIGLEETRYRYMEGTLEVVGLLSYYSETPRTLYGVASKPLVVTSDGALPDPSLRKQLEVPRGLPNGAFCHWLFINNTNSFIVIAAENAHFVWHE